MLDLKNLHSIRMNSEKRLNPRDTKFNQLYSQGINLIEKFINSSNQSFLKEAANKLIEAAKLVKNNPETYFFLSYIFYILGDFKIATKYLKVCSLINPDLAGINKLKKLVYENSNSGLNIPRIQKANNYVQKANEISVENRVVTKTGIQRANRITKG